MMKRVKRSLPFVLLGLLSMVPLTVFSNNAFAVSAYDDVIKPTSTIKLDRKNYYNSWNNTGTCNELDITNTWGGNLFTNLDTLFYNYGSINGISGNGDDAQSAMIDSFNQALTTGSWGLYQQRVYDANPAYLTSPDSDYDQEVVVFWNENSQMPVDFVDLYTGEGPTGYRQYAQTTAEHYAIISFYNGNLGGSQNCNPMVNYVDASVIWVGSNSPSWQNQSVKLFHMGNATVTYPSGYEGPSVTLVSAPPAVTGNVQCVNTNNVISAVQINTQSGVDGNATLTDDGIGGKNYRYYMWEESPYSLIVLCDGDPFYGPTVDTDLYSYYYWACAASGSLKVCAAS